MPGEDLWRRSAAGFVDFLLVLLPTAALGWAAVPVMQRMVAVKAQRVGRRTGARIMSSGPDGGVPKETARLRGDDGPNGLDLRHGPAGGLVFWFLYDWFAHAHFGRTLGKLVCGPAVVRAGGAGRPGPSGTWCAARF